jgi:hypothetical protein
LFNSHTKRKEINRQEKETEKRTEGETKGARKRKKSKDWVKRREIKQNKSREAIRKDRKKGHEKETTNEILLYVFEEKAHKT